MVGLHECIDLVYKVVWKYLTFSLAILSAVGEKFEVEVGTAGATVGKIVFCCEAVVEDEMLLDEDAATWHRRQMSTRYC